LVERDDGPAFKSKRGKQQHHPAISNASSLQSNWLKNTTRSNRISFFFQPPDNAAADPALTLHRSNFSGTDDS
jgi:penicillin-binding protein-related factor A (putative recombinase)